MSGRGVGGGAPDWWFVVSSSLDLFMRVGNVTRNLILYVNRQQIQSPGGKDIWLPLDFM